MDDLKQLVPLKNSLQQSSKFQQISDLILCRIKDVPNVEEHKTNNELIVFMCNLIENLVKKKYNLNKLELLVFTLKRAVELSPEDESIVKNAVEFLHANKLINKIATSSQLKQYIKKFFLKSI